MAELDDFFSNTAQIAEQGQGVQSSDLSSLGIAEAPVLEAEGEATVPLTDFLMTPQQDEFHVEPEGPSFTDSALSFGSEVLEAESAFGGGVVGAQLGASVGALTGPAAPVAIPVLGAAGFVGGAMAGGSAYRALKEGVVGLLGLEDEVEPDPWYQRVFAPSELGSDVVEGLVGAGATALFRAAKPLAPHLQQAVTSKIDNGFNAAVRESLEALDNISGSLDDADLFTQAVAETRGNITGGVMSFLSPATKAGAGEAVEAFASKVADKTTGATLGAKRFVGDPVSKALGKAGKAGKSATSFVVDGLTKGAKTAGGETVFGPLASATRATGRGVKGVAKVTGDIIGESAPARALKATFENITPEMAKTGIRRLVDPQYLSTAATKIRARMIGAQGRPELLRGMVAQFGRIEDANFGNRWIETKLERSIKVSEMFRSHGGHAFSLWDDFAVFGTEGLLKKNRAVLDVVGKQVEDLSKVGDEIWQLAKSEPDRAFLAQQQRRRRGDTEEILDDSLAASEAAERVQDIIRGEEGSADELASAILTGDGELPMEFDKDSILGKVMEIGQDTRRWEAGEVSLTELGQEGRTIVVLPSELDHADGLLRSMGKDLLSASTAEDPFTAINELRKRWANKVNYNDVGKHSALENRLYHRGSDILRKEYRKMWDALLGRKEGQSAIEDLGTRIWQTDGSEGEFISFAQKVGDATDPRLQGVTDPRPQSRNISPDDPLATRVAQIDWLSEVMGAHIDMEKVLTSRRMWELSEGVVNRSGGGLAGSVQTFFAAMALTGDPTTASQIAMYSSLVRTTFGNNLTARSLEAVSKVPVSIKRTANSIARVREPYSRAMAQILQEVVAPAEANAWTPVEQSLTDPNASDEEIEQSVLNLFQTAPEAAKIMFEPSPIAGVRSFFNGKILDPTERGIWRKEIDKLGIDASAKAKMISALNKDGTVLWIDKPEIKGQLVERRSVKQPPKVTTKKGLLENIRRGRITEHERRSFLNE